MRQQEDLARLTRIRMRYAETIKVQDDEITRLLRLVREHEEQEKKQNEIILRLQSEKADYYRADASKRGERID